MDEVFIKDLLVQGIIGVYEWERKQPQDILVNIRLFTETQQTGSTDDIKDCIDYGDIAEKIRLLIENSNRYTVEALAEDISDLCLDQPRVLNLIVRVEKPGVVTGASSVGVQIKRERKE